MLSPMIVALGVPQVAWLAGVWHTAAVASPVDGSTT